MSRSHIHRCKSCGAKFQCFAEEVRNPDGVPEVICLAFHEGGMTECEACHEKSEEMLVECEMPEPGEQVGEVMGHAPDVSEGSEGHVQAAAHEKASDG